jgi:hypothetical protein
VPDILKSWNGMRKINVLSDNVLVLLLLAVMEIMKLEFMMNCVDKELPPPTIGKNIVKQLTKSA